MYKLSNKSFLIRSPVRSQSETKSMVKQITLLQSRCASQQQRSNKILADYRRFIERNQFVGKKIVKKNINIMKQMQQPNTIDSSHKMKRISYVHQISKFKETKFRPRQAISEFSDQNVVYKINITKDLDQENKSLLNDIKQTRSRLQKYKSLSEQEQSYISNFTENPEIDDDKRIILKKLAMKVVKVEKEQSSKELYYLKKLHHPNIINLQHFFITNEETHLMLHMIFPLYDCNLKQLIQRYKNNHQMIFWKLIIYQIAKGLAFMHNKQIIHRDINPTNILVDLETLQIVIADFGSAKRVQSGEVQKSQILKFQESNFYIGQRSYRAPELLLGAKEYNEKVDIWAFGCLIGEIFLTQPLFQGNTSLDLIADIIKLIGTPTQNELQKMKTPLKELKMPQIYKLHLSNKLPKIPQQDILFDLIDQMLVFDPSKRISAFDCLMHPFFNELKQQNLKINSKSLPDVFNLTKEEMNIQIYKDNLFQLIPEWYQEKQRKNEYLQTNQYDAELMLKK